MAKNPNMPPPGAALGLSASGSGDALDTLVVPRRDAMELKGFTPAGDVEVPART
jgi:hypothetical protein